MFPRVFRAYANFHLLCIFNEGIILRNGSSTHRCLTGVPQTKPTPQSLLDDPKLDKLKVPSPD
jgi:hypothetical protein